MLEEYDFSQQKGVRGKYDKAVKNGYSVRVLEKGKIVKTKHYAAIDADVHDYFPDSRAINKALRRLISIIPTKKSAS